MATNTPVVDGYMHVRDGMIVASGPGPVPPELVENSAHYDLGETPVLPGFVDPHMHLEQAAVAMYGSVDCHAEVTDSIDAIVEQLRSHREVSDARGGWLLGQANLFMDQRLAEMRYPTRDDLDRVSSVFPVVLRCGSHVSVLNSVAVERLIGSNPTMRPDSAIETDADGRPNGVIHDLFHALRVPDLAEAELRNALRGAVRGWLTGNGVTTCGEITDTLRALTALAELSRGGAIAQRIHAYPCVPWVTDRVSEAIEISQRSEFLTDKLRMDCIKLFVDGGYSARGAAVLRPYMPDDNGEGNHHGRMAYSEEELAAIINEVDAAGLQLVSHTNGERAQRALCNAAASLQREGRPRIRLEHAGNFISDFETLDYWRKAKALPVAQPAFVWSMGPFMPQYLGEYAHGGLMPFRSLLERGIELAFASDAAASDPRSFRPLFGMQCAITRLGCTGEEIKSNEALDFMTALRMHTVEPAKVMGLEGSVGTLEAGAHADFLLLSGDPSTCSPHELAALDVTHTFIDGVCVEGSSAQ
jgi:predicted amidohydrolase YtcJ